MLKLKKKTLERDQVIKIDNSNFNFLEKVMSKSGYQFHELYYVNGNRYMTCLQVSDFDEETYTGFMNDVVSIQDVLVMLDTDMMSADEYNDRVNKVIGRSAEKEAEAKRYMHFKSANEAKVSMMEFSNYVTQSKDKVNLVTLRIYVLAQSLDELQNKVNKLIDKIEYKKMKAYVQTNNLIEDSKALTMFSNPVKKMVASRTIAQFLNHSEINRIDPNMGLIGYTDNGLYAPDIFLFKDNYSYNTLDLGGMGAGKSALRKLFEEMLLSFGNHILFLFDIHNEYEAFAQQLNIETVSIDEKNNVNLMQIFHVSNKSDDDLIRQNDISTQIALVSGRFKSASGVTDDNVISQFELLLNDFYEPFLNKSLKQLSNADWFTLSDVLEEANKRYEQKAYESEALKDVYKMRLQLKRMIEIYGYLFDRKTNIEFDLTKSLRFDVSFLRESDDTKIKSSYMSLLLNYVSYGMFLNKERNEKAIADQGLKAYELDRPIYTMRILIDETMEYGDIYFFDTMLRFLKFARKAYVGLGFIFHDVQDFEKEFGNGSSTGQKLVKEVFSLCTNKYIGKCGDETLNRLHEYIPIINQQDIRVISHFDKGLHGERQFFAIDGKKRKVKFTSEVTKSQREYFKGGV